MLCVVLRLTTLHTCKLCISDGGPQGMASVLLKFPLAEADSSQRTQNLVDDMQW